MNELAEQMRRFVQRHPGNAVRIAACSPCATRLIGCKSSSMPERGKSVYVGSLGEARVEIGTPVAGPVAGPDRAGETAPGRLHRQLGAKRERKRDGSSTLSIMLIMRIRIAANKRGPYD